LNQFGILLSWIIFLLALYLPIETLFKVDSKIFGAFAFTSPIAFLFCARALDGLTGGNVSVPNAYLADITVEKDRNLNFGKMAISENLGFIVGPALASILSVTEYGDAAPFFGAIIISFIGTLLVMFYIPKNKECYLKEPESTGKMEKIYGYLMKEYKNMREIKKPGFKEVFELPNIPYMFFLYFLIFLGFNIFYTSFPLHAIAVLNWDIAQMGDLLHSSECPPDNRAGYRASQSFKKISRFNTYYFWEPNAYDKFFTFDPWKLLSYRSSNRIFCTWGWVYVAFFSFTSIKDYRGRVSRYNTRICM